MDLGYKGQNLEDKIVDELFNGEIKSVLDIGANGVHLSNSYFFIQKGGSAVLVEPSPKAFNNLKETYKNNNNVALFNVAIAQQNEKEIVFWESGEHLGVGDTSLLSTLHKKELNRWEGTHNTFKEIKVNVWDFQKLLNESPIKKFDLISIDCEGEDINILKQMNLNELECKCLIMEWNGVEDVKTEMLKMVREYGMTLHHKNAENLIFSKKPMKILIKFPTRGRREVFFNTLNKYYEHLDDINNARFVITCDTNDDTMNNTEVTKLLDGYENLEYYFGNSKTKIEACNNDMYDLDFDILLLASDDMIPQIKGYDTIIRNNMIKNYPDKDGVLWFYDGYNKSINTLSIMGVEYYKRFNYIYHPSYESFYCDAEFMIVANELKKQTFINNTIIKHLHPGNTQELHKENDNTYIKNEDNARDTTTFVERMKEKGINIEYNKV